MLIKHKGDLFEIPGEDITLDLRVTWDERGEHFWIVLWVEKSLFKKEPSAYVSLELSATVYSESISAARWPLGLHVCESPEIQELIARMWLTKLRPRVKAVEIALRGESN